MASLASPLLMKAASQMESVDSTTSVREPPSTGAITPAPMSSTGLSGQSIFRSVGPVVLPDTQLQTRLLHLMGLAVSTTSAQVQASTGSRTPAHMKYMVRSAPTEAKRGGNRAHEGIQPATSMTPPVAGEVNSKRDTYSGTERPERSWSTSKAALYLLCHLRALVKRGA